MVRLVFGLLAALLGAGIARAQPLEGYELAGRWAFDEGAGAVARDVSLLHSHGKVAGGRWVVGVHGTALAFGGSNDCVVVADNPGFTVADKLSVQFWMKAEPSAEKGVQYLIGKGGAWYVRYVAGEDAIHFGVSIGGWRELYSKTKLAPGRWHYVACVYNGQRMEIYINGALDSSTGQTGALAGNDEPLILGTCPWSRGTEGFLGALDEVRVHSRACTADEIRYTYEVFAGRGHRETPEGAKVPAQPAVLLDVSHGKGETIADKGRVGLTAKLSNVTWSTGPTGAALELNGTNSFVIAEPGPGGKLGLREAITVAFWTKPAGNPEADYLVGIGGNMFVRRRNGALNFGLSIGGWQELFSVAPVPVDEWSHIACTYDGQHMKLYLNGELEASRLQRGTFDTEGQPLVLGATAWAGKRDGFMKGLMGDVALYDRAIALDELAHHDAGLAALLKSREAGRKQKSADAQKQFVKRQQWFDALVGGPMEAGTLPKGWRARVTSAMAGVPVLPDTELGSITGADGSRVSILAAPGEYESASIVLRAPLDVNHVQLSASDLVGTNGRIAAAAVDLKVVKCWFQDGNAWKAIEKNWETVFVPELLLNDEALVELDEQTQDNYLRVANANGETNRVWISERQFPDPKEKERVASIPAKLFPIRDAERLQPVRFFADKNKQFWVTVHVPEDAAPGAYRGKIHLTAGDKKLGALSLTVQVLPFKLAEARTWYDLNKPFTTSLYYWGEPITNDVATIGAKNKSLAQLGAELTDLRQHNVNDPILIWSPDLLYRNPSLLHAALKVREEAGMRGGSLCFGDSGSLQVRTNEGGVKELEDNVRRLLATAREFGVTNVYLYGVDERRGDELKVQRRLWEAARQAGAKVIVSGFAGQFEAVGDILDICVWAFAPKRDEARKWHSVGHQIWSYYNPQAGVENPEINRRNFGLRLWKAEYDGASTYCNIDIIGMPWNDFDHNYYRRHGFTLPGAERPIGTIEWAGYREAADDVRYATTLRQAIAAAEKSGDRKRKSVATAARRYLEDLDVTTGDLDTARWRMIQLILEFGGQERW